MNKALEIAQKILDELSRKGLDVGNETIIKAIYESLRLNCNKEYTEGPIGAMFFLINGVDCYAYVIGRQDNNAIGHRFPVKPEDLGAAKKIMFSYYESHSMKIAWVDADPNITIEDVMLEMKNIVADVVKEVYKCTWNAYTQIWEEL